MRPDEWIWRDRLNPAPVLTRMVPPLLATYWLGNNRAINLTNEEASQALASLGQIVINLAVSPAFVHVEPWLENLEPRQSTLTTRSPGIGTGQHLDRQMFIVPGGD